MPDRAGVPVVPGIELVVLKHVLEHPGVTVGELARSLGMQQPNTSAAVRGLVKRGLVTRESDDGDRRVVRIQPSDRALSERHAIAQAWAGSLALALGELDGERLAELDAAVQALRALDQAIRARD